ncbi:MAG: FHA domain-containing protein [Lachnospiraceae bacterium]|nr:FHA domain-containing protein [Lachnospiraceae bacterium]
MKNRMEAMQISYRKSMDHYYLVITQEEEGQEDYQMRMVLENKIPGLLPVEVKLREGRKELYYEISSMQPLARIYDRKELSGEEIRHIVGAVLDVLAGMQDYLLDEEHVLLDPGYIFTDPETKELRLLFLPAAAEEENVMLALAEFFMEHADHRDAAAALGAYQFYQAVRKGNYVMAELRGAVERKENGEDTKRLPRAEAMEEVGQEPDTVSGRSLAGYGIGNRPEQARYKSVFAGEEAALAVQEPKYASNGSLRGEEDFSKGWEEEETAFETGTAPQEEKKESGYAAYVLAAVMILAGAVMCSGTLPGIYLDGAGKLVAAAVMLAGIALLGLQIIRKKKAEKEKTAAPDAVSDRSSGRLRDRHRTQSDIKKVHLEEKMTERTQKAKEKEEDAWEWQPQNVQRKGMPAAGKPGSIKMPGKKGETWDFDAVFADLEEPDTVGGRISDGHRAQADIKKARITEEKAPVQTKESGTEEEYGKTVFIGETDAAVENILVEKGKKKEYRMDHFPYTIGKRRECVDLALSDSSVSRIHARILMQNGKAYLQDCHSTNGTYLNGVQLEAEEKVMLEKEDEIEIGKVKLCYL